MRTTEATVRKYINKNLPNFSVGVKLNGRITIYKKIGDCLAELKRFDNFDYRGALNFLKDSTKGNTPAQNVT